MYEMGDVQLGEMGVVSVVWLSEVGDVQLRVVGGVQF